MKMRTVCSRVLLLLLAMLALCSASVGQLRISVGFGPPAIPVYEQPVCPGDGYIWTPGYWAWDPDVEDYYWVPGTWVLAPEPEYYWTPPYWAWVDGGFVFYDGWWGPHVGFYGGINYGFGYFGVGFVGGRWQGGHFFYNRDVMNVNVTVIHNVYNERITNITTNRVSYNGGNGGVIARPTPQDEEYMHERHLPPVAAQQQHIQTARGNPELRASSNHGRPPIAATARPTEFREGAVPAREAGAPYNPPANRAGARPAEGGGHPAVHPNELPPIERPAAPNTGNADLDRKYQQQQDKLFQKQQQERQNLQQRQEQEHQRADQQHASDQQRQQMEQRHQQQTQQMQQRHAQQQQRLQERQAPKGGGRR
jgi:hypothetical protein